MVRALESASASALARRRRRTGRDCRPRQIDIIVLKLHACSPRPRHSLRHRPCDSRQLGVLCLRAGRKGVRAEVGKWFVCVCVCVCVCVWTDLETRVGHGKEEGDELHPAAVLCL
eukprot:3903905-Rhodomonas_salina.2